MKTTCCEDLKRVIIMNNPNFTTTLPVISSSEEYEKIKLKTELFELAAREIIAYHHIPDEPLTLLDGSNIVFSCGKTRIIKIYPPLHQSHFTCEILLMKYLHNKLSVRIPSVEYAGEISGWPYIVMSRLEGTLLEDLWERLDHSNKTVIIRELGSLIHEVHSLPTEGLESIDCHWQQFIFQQLNQCKAQHRDTHLPDELVQQIPMYLESMKKYLPEINKPVILTGEYTPMNLLVSQKSGVWHITGLIDFGDSMLGMPQYDLLGPGVFLIQGDKILLREFLTSYGYSSEDMTSTLTHQLTALMLLHRYANLNVQIRIKDWNKKVNKISELENLVWGF